MVTRKRTQPTAPKPPEDETETTVTETAPEVEPTEDAPEKKTRKPDPLLAAKRRLEAARKAADKANAKAAKVEDIMTARDAANAELEAAEADFKELISAYI